MPIHTTSLTRFLFPATLLLLAIACVIGHLTDIKIVDLTSGFSHPLEGWDHIVTMLGVGIWAAQLRGKAIWLLPTTFVGVMSLGGISGAANYLAVPSAEILIVLSCLVFSVLILRKVRFDIRINMLIVAFFAFFHGFAHGQEISTSASLISYTLGFMIATLLLHGAGILIAKVILLSIAFFIAQMLNVVVSTESAKTVKASYSQLVQNDFQQLETQSIEKPPLINHSPQWLNLSPPLASILQTFTLIKTYFVLSTLLLVFSVSQFVCYVFYIKQRCDFVFYSKFLACCFNCRFFSFAVLPTPSRSNQIFSNLNSKGIFMSIRLPKVLALFLLFPSFAHAHSMAFTQIDWNSGFLHPLQGLDHIVAMLAVGFWAAQLRGRAIWLLPLTFVSVMTLGGLLGTSGISLDYAETIILISGFVLSIFALKKVQFDLKVSALIVGFFALFHGFAHGAEIADSADLVSYSIGFITATSLLHIAGIVMSNSTVLTRAYLKDARP
ncbi:MAG: HupE/UreJ family protein [Methylococcales bacterium]|nr:HupE/UreJ family protein [Methylococcales bacterium]